MLLLVQLLIVALNMIIELVQLTVFRARSVITVVVIRVLYMQVGVVIYPEVSGGWIIQAQ